MTINEIIEDLMIIFPQLRIYDNNRQIELYEINSSVCIDINSNFYVSSLNQIDMWRICLYEGATVPRWFDEKYLVFERFNKYFAVSDGIQLRELTLTKEEAIERMKLTY